MKYTAKYYTTHSTLILETFHVTTPLIQVYLFGLLLLERSVLSLVPFTFYPVNSKMWTLKVGVERATDLNGLGNPFPTLNSCA